MSLEKLVLPESKEPLKKKNGNSEKHTAASLKLPNQRQPEHPKKQYELIKNLMINRIFIVLK